MHLLAPAAIVTASQNVNRRDVLRIIADAEKRGKRLRLLVLDFGKLLFDIALCSALGGHALFDGLHARIELVNLFLVGGLILGAGKLHVVGLRSGEERLHAVVVGVTNGIELVIVASGA